MVIRVLVEGKMVFWRLILLLLLRLEEKVDLSANEVELVREIDSELRFQLRELSFSSFLSLIVCLVAE